jgi:hypothetical protein
VAGPFAFLSVCLDSSRDDITTIRSAWGPAWLFDARGDSQFPGSRQAAGLPAGVLNALACDVSIRIVMRYNELVP